MENLEQAIAQQIQQSEHKRITFAEFMEMALYHPQFGYYSTPSNMTGGIIGAQGDFVTSPHMGRDFGELIAEQFVDMWEALGQPETFTVMEMGAGQGLIAGDAIAHIHKNYPRCFEHLRYIIVEKSPALKAEQQKRLSPWQQRGLSISWQSLENVDTDSLIGCAFSNELVDAFPVHLVKWCDQQLHEMWVICGEEGWCLVVGVTSTDRLGKYFENIGIDFNAGYANGYNTEVNLAALDWLTQVETKLKRGYVLTIDYGYTAERYYSQARKNGTLQCYYRHSYHNDPFINIGEQDITAHVDFTALQKHGETLGLADLGFTQQGL
ncbi:MAG: SAM-dependent methyltransferase, partial [Cyanobacteria bacterium J06632_3]